MSTATTTYKGLTVFADTPTSTGGLFLQNNLKTIADMLARSLAASLIETLSITFDGGGSVLTTGNKIFRECATSGTIVGITMIADQTGSCTIAVRKSDYATFPTTDSIVASAPPTITSAQKSTDNTLTGWTTAVTAGDILEFSVSSATAITRVQLFLRIQK